MTDWIIGNPTWDAFVELDEELARIDVVENRVVPQARIDKVFAKRQAAIERVLVDPGILRVLRAAAVTETRPDARTILEELLRIPIQDFWPDDVEGLLADPRVALHADEVEVAAAFYLATRSADVPVEDLELGPYSGEPLLDPLDQDFRRLHRCGGVPTRVPGVEIPDTVFLLQVDLRTLHAENSWLPAAVAAGDQVGLPRDGILQVFHTTRGDSVTEAELAGGGVSLVYLPENRLLDRSTPLDVEADYPVRELVPSFLPTFATTPVTSPDGYGSVEALQREADTIATALAGVEVSLDPTAPDAPRWSRLLGLPDLSWGVEDGDRDVLDESLPLRSDEDRHVLLLNLASDADFDRVFGDLGRLEIWIRASDLAAARFVDVVSFLKMT